MGDARAPDRATLDGLSQELLNRGGRRNPDVYVVAYGGLRMVVKDFAPRGAFVRATVGRWVTRRERRAWARLDGLAAVPAFYGDVDALAFAVEYRPGRRMSRKLAGNVPADFIERLGRALAEMHARGIVHLDLRHRSNILVDEAGAPVLIDFGSAFAFRPGGLLARLLLPALARIDRRALEKWRVRIAPAS